jgi:hypothetical protein
MNNKFFQMEKHEAICFYNINKRVYETSEQGIGKTIHDNITSFPCFLIFQSATVLIMFKFYKKDLNKLKFYSILSFLTIVNMNVFLRSYKRELPFYMNPNEETAPIKFNSLLMAMTNPILCLQKDFLLSLGIKFTLDFIKGIKSINDLLFRKI